MARKILIPGWSLGENAWGVTKPYLEFFSQFGQVEILTPREEIVEGDLLVLPGGADLNPLSYGEKPGFMTGSTDVYKQYFYDVNLPKYLEKEIPIFGICLGFQQLCVKFGGRLIQNGTFGYSNPRTERSEEILTVGKRILKVNTLHHQGVQVSDMPSCLKIIATSRVYGTVEAFKHISHPIAGVQWHPEEIWDEFSIDLINQLLT